MEITSSYTCYQSRVAKLNSAYFCKEQRFRGVKKVKGVSHVALVGALITFILYPDGSLSGEVRFASPFFHVSFGFVLQQIEQK